MSEEIIIETEFEVIGESKEDVIQKIVDKGIKIGVIQADYENELYEAFMKREEQGTTGLVDGYAIPHAQSPAVNRPAVVIFKLNNELDWESMDGKPTNFIFGILVPSEQKGTSHLKILSEIAKMLTKKAAKDQLSAANSKESIMKVIQDYTSI